MSKLWIFPCLRQGGPCGSLAVSVTGTRAEHTGHTNVPRTIHTNRQAVFAQTGQACTHCTQTEQIVDIPVPRTIEEIVEQISVVPQTTGKYGHVLRPVPSERIQERLVDVGFIKGLDRYNMPRPGDVMVSVPQIREAALEVDAPQECVQDVAEQVIEVPEISLQNGNLQRASLQAPQLVEQLVEVPTVPFSVEQIIDNPVPGRGASGHGGLQDCLPEQSSTAFGGADHRFPSPVRGSRGGGPQGSRPEQSSTAFGGADHPFPLQFVVRVVEVPKVFAQDRIQQRFSEQNMNLFTVAQDRIQQRFGEQNMDLFTVFVMTLGSTTTTTEQQQRTTNNQREHTTHNTQHSWRASTHNTCAHRVLQHTLSHTSTTTWTQHTTL